MTLSELNVAIIKWAEDRQILKHSSAYAQAFKTAEEVMELVEAITCHKFYNGGNGFHRDGLDEVRDAIGDIYVTLVVGVACCGEVGEEMAKVFNPSVIISDVTDQKYIAASLINLGRYTNSIKKLKDGHVEQAEWLAGVISQIAKKYGTNLEACVNQAYNQIKDRKGYLNAQGIFVKDEA